MAITANFKKEIKGGTDMNPYLFQWAQLNKKQTESKILKELKKLILITNNVD